MSRREGAYEQISDSLRGSIDQKFPWVIELVPVSILLPLVERFVPHG